MKKRHNVHGGGTRKAASRRKKELALALCVSLWMAGGSVAGATTVTVTDVATATAGDPAGLFHHNGYFNGYYINEATGCILNITGGTSTKDFVASFKTSEDVFKNTLNMKGGSVREIYGGYAGGSGNANDNTVNLRGGDVTEVYGGYAGGSGNANNNTVNLYAAGTKTPEVYGGRSDYNNAMNNTINVLSAMNLGYVYGGIAANGKTSSGNTLNIAAKGVKMTQIWAGTVQKLNFYLPANIAAGETMLTITGNDATVLRDMTIAAAALKGVNLAKGESVNLIVHENANGLTTDDTTDMTNAGSAALGTASFLAPNNLTTDKKYTLGISKKDANTIIATVSDVTESDESERAKSLVETRAATTTFVNAGADMLASQGFAQAANAVALEAAESGKTNAQGVPVASSFTPFSAFGGSSMRAESGSYVDTKGFGLNVGFAKEFSNAQGKLLFGPVVEYGGGSYDSYLDDGTHGEGNSHYFGIGVMARQVNHDGFYYEGSLRGGRVTSDYKGDLDGVGRVDYDSASNYFAAHLGVGKAFEIGNDNTLDGYFKYFYSHQAGDTATIHIEGLDDETGDFDAVGSHRIRLGARLTHTINEKNKLYGGLAYQYEFGGEARAHFNGNGVPSPSVKGSSGMLELGWQVKPGDGPLTLDLGVTGWAGKQRGGSVQLGATWNF